jgi:DNA sulfur modification protein DndD
MDLAKKARQALDEYLAKLTATKVAQLENATMECFSQLCRKGDLVHKIHIDPRTFAVELADSAGRRVPKAELSAGEKQIYAISVLWALGRVSGRPLPMLIDTPLGRLDTLHRKNLVANYFPVASHQVIILSTDTEVDVNCYGSMRGSISHAIHLVNHDGWTEARPGYFWSDKAEATLANA